MSDIKKWKTPAASNVGSDFTPPDGFPEGMLRSDVNNSMREVQASLRRLWDDPDWKDPVDGFTVVQGADDTKVKIQATDATGYFKVNQKVRVRSSSSASAYAFVTSSAMAGSDTVVTLEAFDVTGTPTPSTSVPADCNGIDIYFLGGGETNNHGIGRSAFSTGSSVGFEVPATNDAAGINAAIVAASSNGKTVLLPAATVTLDASLVITSSTDNVRIVGRGPGSVSILTMGDGLNLPVISLGDGCDKVTLENFYIIGNSANQTTAGDGITIGNNAKRIRIRDIWIQDVWGNAIDFGGTASGGGESYEDIWIESSKIDTCGNTGIYITDPNSTNERIFISAVSVRAFGDTGDATTSGAQACGIDISGRVQMEGLAITPVNSATQHASFAGAGIRFSPSGGSGPFGGRRCQVSNFRIAGDMAGVTGLHLRGADCQVSNGYVDLSGTGTVKPISVEGSGSGAAGASDTIIANVNVADGTRSEILGTAQRVMIEGCHFTAASETCLLVGGDYTKVLNCSFDGGTSGFTIAKGIEVQTGADGVEIKGCLIRGCTGHGILCSGGSDIVIMGNTLSDILGDGVNLGAASERAVVTGNHFDTISGTDVVIPNAGTLDASGDDHTVGFNTPEANTEFFFPFVGDGSGIPTGQSAFNIADGERPMTGLGGVRFPMGGANGNRRYRVWGAVTAEEDSVGTTMNIYVRMGTAGDETDPILYTVHTGSIVGKVYNGAGGDIAPITPASGAKLTMSFSSNKNDLDIIPHAPVADGTWLGGTGDRTFLRITYVDG